MASPISFRARKITSSLQQLEEISSNQQLDVNPFETVTHDEIIDILERFKIWAGNIGALQALALQSSLDYRLRDTPKLTTQIAELLDELNQALEKVFAILSHSRPNRVSSAESSSKHDNLVDPEANEFSDSDSDTSEEQSEIREIYGSIIDGINNLFRFSMIIRRNTPRDRYAKAAAAAAAKGYVFDERPDIRYVMDKFSAFDAGKKMWLANRLGKAIAQRRQYLRYCEDHDLAMKLGVEQEATSRPKTGGQSVLSKPSSGFAPTQASTLLLAPGQIPEYDDTDEAQSQTSFATTIDNNSSNQKLQVVQLEVARKGLNPFPCPYCHQIKVIDTQKAWERHVLSDLKPYVCAFENCQLRMFPDRHTWFSHELKEHRREWKCPFCSHSTFKLASSFESHLKHSHATLFIDAQLPSLLEMGQQTVIQISPRHCPFCDDWEKRLRKLNPHIPATDAIVVTPSQYKHHVGGHMEQLALFAIPRGHTETGDADSNDSAPGPVSRGSSRSEYSNLQFEELDANAKEVDDDRQLGEEQEYIEAIRQAKIEAKIRKLEEELASGTKKLRGKAAAEQKKLKEEAAAEAARLRREADEEAKKLKKEAAEVLGAMAKPTDEPKKPIKFKDAVGRKFSFPFHLCATWAGIEQLLNEAFKNVEALAPHVRNGHYDLINPDGEIVLPQVWETMIEPGWSITMHMWPVDTKFPGGIAPPRLGLLQSGAQLAGGSALDPDSREPDVDVDAQVVTLQKEAGELSKEMAAKHGASQKPLLFKDAVGRKYSFPFHLCATWPGMEGLIKQCFLHVEVIGPYVQEGLYDLIGPSGEIILPQVWEALVEPGWKVTMHMWLMTEPLRPGPGPPPGHHSMKRPQSRHSKVSQRGPPPPPPPGWGLEPRGLGPPLGQERMGPGGEPIIVVHPHRDPSPSEPPKKSLGEIPSLPEAGESSMSIGKEIEDSEEIQNLFRKREFIREMER